MGNTLNNIRKSPAKLRYHCSILPDFFSVTSFYIPLNDELRYLLNPVKAQLASNLHLIIMET